MSRRFEANDSARIQKTLKKFDVPTLIMHGDHDKTIVPITDTAILSAKLIMPQKSRSEGVLNDMGRRIGGG